jgi:DNA-binding CsgD family transcriptional regulator
MAAAAHAEDPEPLLRPLITQLGFDGLTYITLAPTQTPRERATFLWSTAASAWSARYRDCGYSAVDPRVGMTAHRLSPIVWDGADARNDWHARRFIADAARYGTRGGFAVSFRDPACWRVVIALDCNRSMSEPHCAAIASKLGDLMLLAAALHDRVLSPRFSCVVESRRRSTEGLTRRERQCLGMAANGLTSSDIGSKLGIAERTVNFHMRNVLRKLDALNRSEAIAKALTRGVIHAGGATHRSS